MSIASFTAPLAAEVAEASSAALSAQANATRSPATADAAARNAGTVPRPRLPRVSTAARTEAVSPATSTLPKTANAASGMATVLSRLATPGAWMLVMVTPP